MAVIFLSHDLGVIGEMATMSVMYKGKSVEQGDVEQIFYLSPTVLYERVACMQTQFEPSAEAASVLEDFTQREETLSDGTFQQ